MKNPSLNGTVSAEIENPFEVQFNYKGIQRPEAQIPSSSIRDNAQVMVTGLQGDQERQDDQEYGKGSNGSLTTWKDTRHVTENISWVWDQWLPNGFVTMIASESGQGKSILALWIAGLFTTGEAFPTSEHGISKLGKVLWIETEHGQVMNLDRLTKFGLDDTAFLNPLSEPLDTVQLENAEHRSILRQRAALPEIAVIVVDSLSGSHRLKENSTEMMDILDFLATLAQSANKPVIVVHHFNKLVTDSSIPSLAKVRGSSSIVQFCRLVWAIDTPNPADAMAKRLTVIKSNLASHPEPIGFRIEETGIEFTDAPKIPERETKLKQAKEWLIAQLQEGPIAQRIIEQRAIDHKIIFRTVQRAKKELCVQSHKKKEGWDWELPAQEDHDQDQQNAGTLGNLGHLDNEQDLFGGDQQ